MVTVVLYKSILEQKCENVKYVLIIPLLKISMTAKRKAKAPNQYGFGAFARRDKKKRRAYTAFVHAGHIIVMRRIFVSAVQTDGQGRVVGGLGGGADGARLQADADVDNVESAAALGHVAVVGLAFLVQEAVPVNGDGQMGGGRKIRLLKMFLLTFIGENKWGAEQLVGLVGHKMIFLSVF